MKKYMITALVTGFVLIGMASIANATLMERDFLSAGDNLILYDSDTNLEWLDWNLTYGLSFNQVIGGAGGYTTTHGFTHGTTDQIDTLFSNASIPDVPGVSAANFAPVSALMSQLGITPWSDLSLPVDGTTAFAASGTHQWAAQLNVFQGNGYARTYYWALNEVSAFSTVGHALVREAAPVPEPATMLLLGTGLVGLAGARFRRKNK